MSKLMNDYFYNLDENEQAKEIFAQFGLCVYWFQVLEHQLIDMILIRAKQNNLKLNPQILIISFIHTVINQWVH